MPKDYPPLPEGYDPKKRRDAARQANRDRVAREDRERFERLYRPRDAEERRNAEAEDRDLAKNLEGIMGAVGRMSDAEFEAYLKRNRRKVKKAGGANRVRAERKKRSGWCSLVALVLLLTLVGIGYGIGWGVYQVTAAVVAR